MCPTNISKQICSSNFLEEYIAFSFYLNPNDTSKLILLHEEKNKNQRNTICERSRLQSSKVGYLEFPDGFFGQYICSIEISEDEEDVFDIEVENDNHNFICEGIVVHNCWEEEHNGEKLWVVRKGATPAFPGQKGFVGGSMGDDSVILEGVEHEDSAKGLYSTVHGAGRVLGRMQAKGKFKAIKDASNQKTGEYECVREPLVKKEDMKKWIEEKGVELRGADVDESPQCYKRLNEVLDYHSNTIKILHTLTPIGVAMAGNEVRDPYKD